MALFDTITYDKLRKLVISLLIVIVMLLAIVAGLIISRPDQVEEIVYIPALPRAQPRITYYFSETFCSKTVDFGDSISLLLFLPDRPPTEIRYYEYDNPILDWMELSSDRIGHRK